MHIIDKIDRILKPSLNESAHIDLAVKLLKQHGLVPDGVDPHKIAKGIASRHGVPGILVPQMIHYAGTQMAGQKAFDASRLKQMDPDSPSALHAMISKREDRYSTHMKAYANRDWSMLDGEEGHEGPARRFEAAKDKALNWHALATHPNKHAILHHGVFARVSFGGEDGDTQADKDRNAVSYVTDMFQRVSKNAAAGHASPLRKSFDRVGSALSKYNPLNKETWDPTFRNGILPHDSHPFRFSHAAGSPEHNGMVDNQADQHLVASMSAHLASRRGLIIPHPHDAEHVAEDGSKFRAYSLDTPEKANAGCWGEKYCIATGESGAEYNRRYHGGKYVTSHIVTRVSKGDDGKERQHLHAAYLPGLLKSHPQEAVRNSGNSGAITGEAFDKIHPLLSKLDKKIDRHAKNYKEGTL